MKEALIGFSVVLFLLVSYGFIGYWVVKVTFRWLHEQDKDA